MPDPRVIPRESPDYPANLELLLGDAAPPAIHAAGDLRILDGRKVALFSSRKCPGDLAACAYDIAQHLRDAGLTAVGGFHSPMEKECLRILLRSPYPVIVGLARSLDGARFPPEYRRPLDEGRLLVLSPFPAAEDRTTADTAVRRNRFLGALADAAFVACAEAGGVTEALGRELLGWGKPLLVLESPRHTALLAAGARPVTPASARREFTALANKT
jgi:predicted Rossmann fold nucleotide-binding protein DprA/Smf involved in DNA uptake